MSEWNDDAADYVDAFRDEVAVDVDVDAAWARFEAEVAPARRPVLLWAGAAAALAAALAVAWVAVPSFRGEAEQDGAGQQALDQVAPREPEVAPLQAEPGPATPRRTPREPEVAPAIEESPLEEAPLEELEGSETEGAPTPRKAVRKAKRPAAEPEPESGPSRLAEELRLLESMRAASKARRYSEALTLARKHAKTFGKGPFAAERELTRVRALCGLGRHDAAHKAQARFASSFPASHLGSLVHSACKDPEEKNLNSDHDE